MGSAAKVAAVLAAGALWLAASAPRSELSEQDCAEIEKAVLATNLEMEQAAEAANADRLFEFVLENDKGPIIQNGRLFATRAEALEQGKTNLRGIYKVKYTWRQQYVTVLSPTLAVLTAEGESSVTTDQWETFTNPFAQTVIFERKDGKWRVLHAHQSSPIRR